MNPYAARVRGNVDFAFFPLVVLLASHWVHSLRGSRLSLSVSAVLPAILVG